MKCNYPIKYAVMPIIEQVGWSYGLNELEREYDVVCYIVSKCYLIIDRTKYIENGTKEIEYEVVFPYQKLDYNWERVVPRFNCFNHECTNSDCVEEIFDNYNQALDFANVKNQKLCAKICSYLPFTDIDKILEKKQAFDEKLSDYKILEQEILNNTLDLDQSKVKKLDESIIYKNGKYRLCIDIYNYINHSFDSKFIAYSISLEQYNEVLNLIRDEKYSNISSIIENAIPVLYNNLDENCNNIVINREGKALYYINKWGKIVDNDKQKTFSLDSVDSETRCFYTTETYEDILLTYAQHKKIDLYKELEKPRVLKKNLFNKNKI